MLHDVRYAVRTLIRTPGFTVVAVLSMALGIGGTSAVFSVFHAVFLHPLPFPDPDRLVVLAEQRNSSRAAHLPVSGHEYAAWKEQSASLEGVALYKPEQQNLTGSGEPEMVRVLRVSADFFHLLGLRPALGRTFAEGEDRGGANNIVILSDALWRRQFGADATIVGREITLNDRILMVVGVMQPLPAALSEDVWMPIDVPAEVRAVGRHNLSVIARLRPGLTVEQAKADLGLVSDTLARQSPDENTDHHVDVVPLREQLVGQFRGALLALFAAVGFVLLIASANLTNLLLTRGAGRQREIAVRVALGASPGRLIRQLVVESVLLAMTGGAVGLLMAAWIIDLAPMLTAVDIPLMDAARVDRRTLALAAAISLAAGIGSGLAPALRYGRPSRGARRADAFEGRMNSGRPLIEGNRMSDGRDRRRLRSALVTAEVAWTLMLLVGAGLMLNSFIHLARVNPGFSVENVLVLPVDLPGSRYPQAEQRRQFHDVLMTRLNGIPGVMAVGATSHLPLGGTDNWMMFRIADRPHPAAGQVPTAAFRVVTPGYFRAMQIPLRAGRVFKETDARLSVPMIRWFPQQPAAPGSDRPQATPVAVISDAAARQFWPGEEPVGRRITVLFSPEITIVGVVGDVRHNALNLPSYPHIYLAASQEPWSSLSFVVKTSIPPMRIAAAAREQVRSLDPGLPVTVRSLAAVRSGSVNRERFYAILIGLFGTIALGLAMVGIFGVVSHAAEQRTMEIGVRLALGAARLDIVRLIVSQGMRPIVTGMAIGATGAVLLTGFMQRLLYGIDATDPFTFGAVTILLAGTGLLACWIPAARAARLDPLVALRSE